MRLLLALIIGIAVGAAGLWILSNSDARSAARSTGGHIEDAARSARESIHEKVQVLDLRPQDIREDLERTGKVVRRKARDAGEAIADATADARITASVKGKFVASRELSSLSISVNTTAGVVTLAGQVGSAEEISKAMLIAMETEGVREVISTLQVKPSRTQTAPPPTVVKTQVNNGRK